LSLTPAATVEEIDKKRYGDASYVTFYDLTEQACATNNLAIFSGNSCHSAVGRISLMNSSKETVLLVCSSW
jgi:uncharacterized membrane protein